MTHGLIFADLEGIINAFDLEKEISKDLYTNEVQICIDALIKCGIDKITVCDAHSSGDMIKPTILSGNVNLISQVRNISFEEKYDFAIFIGFHGMENSEGFFPHTFRFDFKEVAINNMYDRPVPIGEVEIYSRWLGFHGVPVILIIGDREATYEANCFNIYRNVCCVKSFFQEKQVDVRLLYEKIESSIHQALKLDSKSCLSHDSDSVSVEFYHNDVVKELGDYEKRNNKIIFKNCADLVNHLYPLVDELNEFNSRNFDKNRLFLKEARLLAKALNKEEFMDSEASELLGSKNLSTLDEKSRVAILTTLRQMSQKVN